MPREPVFNGPIMTFVRKHKLVRRVAVIGGIVVGLYFAGVGLGVWPNIFN
jgi:Kef-type K+ transport system membrane component KefB